MAKPNGERRCSAHGAPAGWRCRHCQKLLCPDCTAVKDVYPTSIAACTTCGEAVELLFGEKRNTQPLAERLPGALVYPLWGEGFPLWLVLSLAWAALSYAGEAGLLLSVPLTVVAIMMTTRAGARDEDDDASEEVGYFTGLARSLAWFGVLGAPMWAGFMGLLLVQGALGAAVHMDAAGGWTTTATGALLLGAVLFFGAPALVLSAHNGTVAFRLNPVRWGAAFWAGRMDTLVLLMSWWLLTAVGLGLGIAGRAFLHLPVPFVGPVAAAAALLFVPFVLGRVAGLYLNLHGDLFGQRRRSRPVEPLLGNTPPRGHLPENLLEDERAPREVAPIELEEDAAPVVAPQRATPEARPLDPRSLPRWENAPEEELGEEALAAGGLDAAALPSLGQTLARRVRACRLSGDEDGALESLEAGSGATAEMDAEDLGWLAGIYVKRDNPQAAQVLYEAAADATGPAHARAKALVQLGELLEKVMQNDAQARAAMERAVAEFGQEPVTRFARAWLKAR